MKKNLPAVLAAGAWLAVAAPLFAANHFWELTSPDHAQTWAYGNETNRVWKDWRGHLALLLTFTNDPDVGWDNPRQWDNFRFDFPNLRLGADGRTFYYHTAEGRRIPVATRRPDFLGIDEVKLLPSAHAVISRPSGTITVSLHVVDTGGLTLR